MTELVSMFTLILLGGHDVCSGLGRRTRWMSIIITNLIYLWHHTTPWQPNPRIFAPYLPCDNLTNWWARGGWKTKSRNDQTEKAMLKARESNASHGVEPLFANLAWSACTKMSTSRVLRPAIGWQIGEMKTSPVWPFFISGSFLFSEIHLALTPS